MNSSLDSLNRLCAYFLPENEYTQWTNHGFIYRTDIAKEAGLSEVKSWDDLDKYFECVNKKHPEMTPWDFAGDSGVPALGYIMSSMKYVPIYEVTTYGLWGEDLNNKGKIISPFYKGDEFVEYARLMKKWNQMGVWRNNVSTAERWRCWGRRFRHPRRRCPASR